MIHFRPVLYIVFKKLTLVSHLLVYVKSLSYLLGSVGNVLFSILPLRILIITIIYPGSEIILCKLSSIIYCIKNL